MRKLFLAASILIACNSYAQIVFEPISGGAMPGGGGIMQEINVYGSALLGKKMTYAEIKGNPYFDTSFKPAALYDGQGKPYGKFMTKINLYTNEIHFLNKEGEELIANKGAIRTIAFFKRDTIDKITKIFECGYQSPKNPEAINEYYEVMNLGDGQLLKSTRKFINQYDSQIIYKRYRFLKTETFYISYKGQLYKLNRLSKDQILSSLPTDDTSQDWITAKGNKMRKEEEIVAFLDYYNSRRGNNIKLKFE